MDPILFPDEPTPAWLTAVLRQCGILESGEVTALEITDTGAFNSRTARLKISYSAEVLPSLPASMFLKRNTSEAWSKEAGADEVKFYRLVGQLAAPLTMLPTCYAAAYDEASGDSYILLEDLSLTHAPPITRDDQISIVRGVPRVSDQESVIDALAQFHAYWWDHALLPSGNFELGFWSRDAQRFASYLEHRRNSWQTLMRKEGSWFSPHLVEFYEGLFEALPSFWETSLAARFTAHKNLTLIHGDTYFCNFLCPKTPGGGSTILLDWQSPGWDLAGYDLVNLLAVYWTRAQRLESHRERNLLQRYFEGIKAHGVEGYTWEDLLADYQAGLIFWILMPVQDGADGADKSYWWPKMQCLLDAFSDWNCMERLSSRGKFGKHPSLRSL